MKSHAPVSRSLNLQAEPDELYPPLLSTSPAVVTFSSNEPATFELIPADEAALYEGVLLHAGPSGGAVIIGPEFISTYTGQWPARLLLRALQQGTLVEEITLVLHDTRHLAIDRMEGDLVPNPAYVGEGFEQRVEAQARFFDGTNVQIPSSELRWSIHVPGAPPGIIVDVTVIRVTPEASPGEVTVVFAEATGFEQSVSLVVASVPDIALEVQPLDMYPPLMSEDIGTVLIEHALPEDAQLDFNCEVNEQPDPHPGLQPAYDADRWTIAVDRMFIATYQGEWPAVVRVLARLDGQMVATAWFRLHDTRAMICARGDFEFNPSATADIPEEGETVVTMVPEFYDAEDIPLPEDELDWEFTMVDPIEGVTLLKHVLLISPAAKPGKYRVGLEASNGVNRARVLALR